MLEKSQQSNREWQQQGVLKIYHKENRRNFLENNAKKEGIT